MKCLVLSLLLIGVCSAIDFVRLRDIECGSVLPDSCSNVRIAVSLHDGCNTCSCEPGAPALACTRKVCPGPKSPLEGKYCAAVQKQIDMRLRQATSRVRCGYKLSCAGVKRAVSVDDGCNTCQCIPGTKEPACTKMTCAPPNSITDFSFCFTILTESRKKIKEASKE